jgi:putative colanic acid biosynthesis glycosyltransferase
MADPFFSIVTVVRNNLVGLAKTKTSIIQQLGNSWEWVIIDGNSTDGTREFALACVEANIKVISESDRGIYDAMNKGLAMATGRYVMFMNSGDLLADDKVLNRVQEELTRDPVHVLFGGSIMRFGLMDIPRPSRSPAYIWHGQPGLHQATVFCREQHVRFPYDADYKICGDYDVITRMWAAGLRFRSTPIIVSVNEFVAEATSGRHKFALIREAVHAQRNNLHLSLPKIAASVSLRMLTSAFAKALTFIESFRAWWSR